MSVDAERNAVPDACAAVSARLTRDLVPQADKTEMSVTDTTDRHRECAWTRYAATQSRQLTVELRAMQEDIGLSATIAARSAFQSERRADGTGKGLPRTQRVVFQRSVTGLGDEGYVAYSADKKQGLGEAVVNIRVVNVLVTIHYAGGDDRTGRGGAPLPGRRATDGALAAARSVVTLLATAN